jgi:hypothetical protein
MYNVLPKCYIIGVDNEKGNSLKEKKIYHH